MVMQPANAQALLPTMTLQPWRNDEHALKYFIRAALTMPRRANDNNPNMTVYEG